MTLNFYHGKLKIINAKNNNIFIVDYNFVNR
jgi:hypothetical protein